MAVPMTPAFSAMIVTIAPAFTIATLIRFTLIPATVVAIIMTPPTVFCATHNCDASSHGRASDHRPSNYRNDRDRQFVI
ncbi:Uncharacterised protein [Escherichia coli]|uniref:Uncharacterized protein n=1 Tax=Escherichia coli TaxID=562 RepID=A0A376Y5U2_ECOLX|nr:Uncharacterised protein [Escherichia coli]